MDVCPDADKRSQFIAQAMERIIILPRSFGPRKIQDRNHLHLLWGWDKLSKGKDDGLLYCQMLLLFAVIFLADVEPLHQHTKYRWDEGVIGMSIGEIAKIHCSPDYAYGAGGFPAWGIMPNSELVFEIEVLSFK